MNNRERMYQSNSRVRKWLIESKYVDIHLFPHTRFSKDVHFQGLNFDGCCSFETKFVLFQIKTNERPSKKILEQMRRISKKSKVSMLWFNCKKRNMIEVWVDGQVINS